MTTPIPAPTQTSYWYLLTLVDQLREVPLYSDQLYAKIKDAIDAGAPLNPERLKDRSLIHSAIGAIKRHGEAVHHHMELLVKSGANPMLRGDFCDTLIEENGGIAHVLLLAMSQAEDIGHLMRDPQGQNPLHICMESGAWSDDNPTIHWERERFHPNWINAKRLNDGYTPLHVLWQWIDEALRGGSDIFTGHITWAQTLKLMDLGARLDISDHHGRSMAQVIVNATSLGLGMREEYEDIFNHAQAIVDQSALEGATAPAGTPSAGPRRI